MTPRWRRKLSRHFLLRAWTAVQFFFWGDATRAPNWLRGRRTDPTGKFRRFIRSQRRRNHDTAAWLTKVHTRKTSGPLEYFGIRVPGDLPFR